VYSGGESGDTTVGELVAAGGYSRHTVEHFLVPAVSAGRSAGPAISAHYPAPGARACWNCDKPTCVSGEAPALVPCHINRSMRLAEPLDYRVSRNATGRVPQSSVPASCWPAPLSLAG
jgi:hypothetical protein